MPLTYPHPQIICQATWPFLAMLIWVVITHQFRPISRDKAQAESVVRLDRDGPPCMRNHLSYARLQFLSCLLAEGEREYGAGNNVKLVEEVCYAPARVWIG